MRSLELMAVAVFGIVSANVQAAACDGFVDVDDSNSAYCAAVTYVKDHNITFGCTDATHFCPNDYTTRLQMALFLQRAAAPATLATLQGSPCTVGTAQSTLNVAVDSATGVVSLVCTPTPSLVMNNDEYSCGATCFGALSGISLMPAAAVNIYAGGGLVEQGTVPANGAVNLKVGLTCGHGWANLYATSTASNGAAITSNTVQSPCS